MSHKDVQFCVTVEESSVVLTQQLDNELLSIPLVFQTGSSSTPGEYDALDPGEILNSKLIPLGRSHSTDWNSLLHSQFLCPKLGLQAPKVMYFVSISMSVTIWSAQ